MKKENEKEEKQGKQKHRDWAFSGISYFFVLLFFVLIGHFINFQVNESESFINSDYNSREKLFAERVSRGEILSSDGIVLAETVTAADGSEKRKYPYKNMFAHIIGYSVNGKSGVEKLANFQLLKAHVSIEEKAEVELSERKYQGDRVVTTLNYELQKTAYEQLGSYKGAIVVLEPSTGKILAMVSKPDFDPNTIEKDWDALVSEENTSTVLLNRATQGLYPPGSTFKIITTLAYLRQNKEAVYSYDCTGELAVNDAIIHCYRNKKHGSLDLEQAFAQSCNASFANIGLSLNKKAFQKVCDSLLFNQSLPTQLVSSKSSFSLAKDAEEAAVMQSAIGQGTTLVTPFHMALLTSAIANDGVLMTPYVIDHLENHSGKLVKQYTPDAYGRLLSTEEAAQLRTYMEAVVTSGTGTKLKSDDYSAAGKTGSAEFSSSTNACHSWFVGYAQKDGKEEIAVAVLVEEAGSGSSVAVPMAKKIFDVYFSE